MEIAEAPYRSIWGSLDVSDPISAHRSGITRYRLEIFPPGTNSIERRQLRRLRSWRVWAAIAALIGAILIGGWWPGWLGPTFVVALYTVVLAVGLHRTSRLRRATRTVSAALVVIGGAPPVIEGDFDLLEFCAADLEALDRSRLDGEVTPVDYELEWSRMYQQLERSAA